MTELKYVKPEVIESWAKELKVNPDPWDIAMYLINVNKNYDTALAILFDLSWKEHRDYLKDAVEYFKINVANNPDYEGVVFDAGWIYEYITFYAKEVRIPPA